MRCAERPRSGASRTRRYGERAPETATKQLAISDGLLLETELLDHRIVAALVIRLEIAQVRTAIGDHLKKTSAGVEILRVLLQMLRELVDLLGEKRDLHIG